MCYWNSKKLVITSRFSFPGASLSMMYQIVPWKHIAVDEFNEECEALTKSISTWRLKRETFNVAENAPINNRIVTVWCIDCHVNMNMTRPLMLLTKGSPRHETQTSIFTKKTNFQVIAKSGKRNGLPFVMSGATNTLSVRIRSAWYHHCLKLNWSWFFTWSCVSHNPRNVC